MKTIIHNNHKIEIKDFGFSKEQVWYDSELVSSKLSIIGSTHIFKVKEDGKDVNYEVEIGIRWHMFSAWVTVRREGIVIFTDR